MSQMTGFNVVSGDPYWGDVVLLTHADSVSPIIDETGNHSFTITAGVNLTTGKFNNGIKLSSEGLMYANTNIDFSNQNFTIEGWFNATGVAGLGNFSCMLYYGNRYTAWNVWNLGLRIGLLNSSGTIYLVPGVFGVDGVKEVYADITALMNSWVHYAFVREGLYIKLYINGSLSGTTSLGSDINLSTYSYLAFLGAYHLNYAPEISPHPFIGTIDEQRITIGVARYTANFTPPTVPFPNS